MKDICWNNIILAEFRFLAILTDEEDKVLTCWAKEQDQVKIGDACRMDDRTVRRILTRLRAKYDDVQPYSPLLPKRKVRNN